MGPSDRLLRFDGHRWCPEPVLGNPSTPFTVELSEPLGDREIVDASVVPPLPVTVARDR